MPPKAETRAPTEGTIAASARSWSLDAGGALVFACLALWLIATTLTLWRPGLPKTLRADEATHLAMATSLALDGDLRWQPTDGRRLYSQFVYTGPVELHLRAQSEGEAVYYFDRPLLYPLLASPFVALMGARGLFLFNALLWLATLGLLWRRGPVFATAALVLSASFVYIFWLHPALLVALLVTLALYPFSADPSSDGATGSEPSGRGRSAFVAGSALALAGGQAPWLMLLAIPAALGLRGRWRPWLGGLGIGAVIAGSLILLAPTDGAPGVFELASPLHSPTLERSPADPPATLGTPVRSLVGEVTAGLGMALFERRSGLLPYFPFVLPIAVLAVLGRRKDRLAIALGSVLVVLGLLQPWLATGAAGEAFANPMLVALYPAFLFLVPGRLDKASRRLRDGALIGGIGLGMLLLGPGLVSMLGPAMAFGNAQGHTRSPLLSRMPLALENIGHGDGYAAVELGPADSFGLAGGDRPIRLWLPTHAAEIHGEEIWILGHTRAELYLEAPLVEGATDSDDSLILQVRNLAPDNRTKLDLGEAHQRLAFPSDPEDPGHTTRIRVQPGPGLALEPRDPGAGQNRLWRLRVETERGEWPLWRGSARERFYLGTAFTLLGTPRHLERPVRSSEWLACQAPPEVQAGDEFLAAIRLRNLSSETWNNEGPVRVRLAYRWVDTAGEILVEGERTELDEAVGPGETLVTWVRARAPRKPGSFELRLEPVYEHVAWFSDESSDAACHRTVEVR